MGSFYMACAASNAPLTDGQEIVACKLKLETGEGRGGADTFNRQWYISDFPQHGVYNDYGRMLCPDGSEVDSGEDDVLFIAKWAWEVLTEAVVKSWEEHDARYVKYNEEGKGWTNYRLQSIQEAKDAINMSLRPGFDPLDKLIDGYKISQALRWGGEGCRNSDKHWRDTILSSEDPHATHDRFLVEVLPIICSTHFVYWRLIPSLYASQDPHTETLIKFYSRGLEFFQARKKEWDEEE